MNSKVPKQRKRLILYDRILSRRIFEDLRDNGSCERCALRYLGERDPNSYRNVSETLKKKIHDDTYDAISTLNVKPDTEKGPLLDAEEPQSKIVKRNPCIACLGLLDDGCQTENIQQICEEVKAAGYDANSFTCAITLPICMLIRSHAIWIHLVATFNDTFSKRREEDQVVSVKEVWKWVASAQVAVGIGKILDSGVSSDFFVGINVLYQDDEKECSCLMEMHRETFQHRQQKRKKYNGEIYTRKAVESALQQTHHQQFKSHFPTPAPIPTVAVVYGHVTCTHTSLYMAGRYRKFSRTLSQTPWVVDGEKKMETSVQELICNRLIPVVCADSARFSASGREDVDVRTLGRGRPFVVEFVNPHRVKFTSEDTERLQNDINKSTTDISIRDLQIVNRDNLSSLKEGEEEKAKRYTAVCVSLLGVPSVSLDLDKLSEIKNLVLQQKTPIRVLHRRPLAIRARSILNMWAVPLEYHPCHFKLHVQTQAGTYVKEFVHGDFGRTMPNLCTLLGTEIDIIALDVEEISLDWPPEIANREDSFIQKESNGEEISVKKVENNEICDKKENEIYLKQESSEVVLETENSDIIKVI